MLWTARARLIIIDVSVSLETDLVSGHERGGKDKEHAPKAKTHKLITTKESK